MLYPVRFLRIQPGYRTVLGIEAFGAGTPSKLQTQMEEL